MSFTKKELHHMYLCQQEVEKQQKIDKIVKHITDNVIESAKKGEKYVYNEYFLKSTSLFDELKHIVLSRLEIIFPDSLITIQIFGEGSHHPKMAIEINWE